MKETLHVQLTSKDLPYNHDAGMELPDCLVSTFKVTVVAPGEGEGGGGGRPCPPFLIW